MVSIASGGVGQDHMHSCIVKLHDIMQSRSTVFFPWEMHFQCILKSYVCDHAASLRISVNADFSTALKCLASGKKPM